MSTSTMASPRVVSREAWREARVALLAKEKEMTRARDALNEERRALPAVEVVEDYVFEGPEGRSGLAELFAGRGQLVVYHFMFDPAWEEGCSGCSHLVDNLPHPAHLHARDTTLVLVSRAPLAKIGAFRARMGWTLPWYSSAGSRFNYDFHATTDPEVAVVEYNYRDEATMEAHGQAYHVRGEQPGMSVFVREGERVLHTYSTYGRGLDAFLNTYNLLDLTPLGRGEGWDGMPDLGGLGMEWLRHHDRYGGGASCCHSAGD